MAKVSFPFVAAAVLFGVIPNSGSTEERVRLHGEAAAAAILGQDLSGRLEGTSALWRECIEASGRTLYWFNGEATPGRVRFDADSRACFAYADDGFASESCFAVERVQGRVRLVLEGRGAEFIVDRAAPIRSCAGADAQS